MTLGEPAIRGNLADEGNAPAASRRHSIRLDPVRRTETDGEARSNDPVIAVPGAGPSRSSSTQVLSSVASSARYRVVMA
jgi:hypothetical protein